MNNDATSPSRSERGDTLFNQSLEKGLAVLSAFDASHRTMTLADIAVATGLNKSSAQRMIYTLVALGYVRKHPRTRRYQLTPHVMEIGFNYLAANVLIDIGNPFLAELAKVTQETTNLTELDGRDMVYVARFVSSHYVPIHMPIGSHIPVYCTASGRAYLSRLPETTARAMLEQSDRQRHTVHTVTDVDAIVTQLRGARERGYAINCEELFLGDMTIAAPVIGSDGLPVASVHVVAPTSRWTKAEAERVLAPPVVQCALALTSSIRALG